MNIILRSLLCAMIIATYAAARPANLFWDKNSPDEGVTGYRVYRIEAGQPVLVCSVAAVSDEFAKQAVPLDVVAGEVYAVSAFNEGGESELSDPVTVPAWKPSAPTGLRVVINP